MFIRNLALSPNPASLLYTQLLVPAFKKKGPVANIYTVPY